MGDLGLWFLHIPRYFAGHLLAHVALLLQWLSLALEGLASAALDAGHWLADVPEDEGFYDFDDFDDDGLA
jgi:hypothetical protein